MKNLPEIPSTNRTTPEVKIDNAARAVELATVLQCAGFLVSPGFNLSVCSLAPVRGVAPVPGVMTPSEVEQASALGLDTVKFLPAEQAGGAAFRMRNGSLFGTPRSIWTAIGSPGGVVW